MTNDPRASLAMLPSDCWLNILEHLSPKDYWHLLFVSKDISSYVQPLLFRDITWEWEPVPFRRVLLLFRAIMQKPERASEIKRLSLLSNRDLSTLAEWEPPSCDTDCKEEIKNFKDVLQHAQAIVMTANFPDPDIWTLALERGDAYALVSILLSQLENLQSLQLDYSFVWQSGFPGLMLRHALSSSSLSQFQFLTDVDYGANIRRDPVALGSHIQNAPGYPQCNPKQFPAWFYLPALRSLKIWLRTKEGIELPDRRADLSGLKRLILARTTIQEAQVPDILSLTPNLETLHLGMTYRWKKEVALQNGPSIIQGLESIRGSLTNLSFGVEYYPPTNCDVWLQRNEEELSTPFYGFLKRLSNLRAVEMPVELLAGWSDDQSVDITLGLPGKVEQLCLRGDYQDVDICAREEKDILDLVADNAARLRSHLPGLRQVCLHSWYPDYDCMARSLDAARAACAQEQIQLKVVSDDLANGIWTESRKWPGSEIY